MGTKKNGNGSVKRWEVIGHETRVVRRELSEDEIEKLETQRRAGYLDERAAKSTFRAFRDFAKPRVEAAFEPPIDVDPEDEDLDESGTLSIDDERFMESARALNDDLEHRRKVTAAKVALIKAERRLLLDAIANRYRYEVVEVDVEIDTERPTEVRIVDSSTGEVIDTRASTDAERQMAFDEDELPAGAPAAVQ